MRSGPTAKLTPFTIYFRRVLQQFSQFFRVYGLATFGKKYDSHGHIIRKYVPELAKFPDKYIYAPHEAPLDVQKSAGCIIGQDYPFPILDEKQEKQHCLDRCKAAYDQKFYGNSKEVLEGKAEAILRKRHGVPEPKNVDAKKRGKDGKIPDWAKTGHEGRTGHDQEADVKATSGDTATTGGDKDDIQPHETDQDDEHAVEEEQQQDEQKKRKDKDDGESGDKQAHSGRGSKKQKTGKK